jgi:predicted metal-dependent enzyme (double-stranded beta helix superfamily)
MSDERELAQPQSVLVGAELERFARELAAAPKYWRQHVREDSTARIYETIWDDEYVNAWIVCWSADNDTGFHDHDLSAGAITVVKGSVREERLALGRAPLSRTFRAGQSFHLGVSAIHRITHAGQGPAISIHAYSPPLTRQGVYRTTDDGALERDAQPFTEELRPASADLLGRGRAQSERRSNAGKPLSVAL